jgi:hypothetical protein
MLADETLKREKPNSSIARVRDGRRKAPKCEAEKSEIEIGRTRSDGHRNNIRLKNGER